MGFWGWERAIGMFAQIIFIEHTFFRCGHFYLFKMGVEGMLPLRFHSHLHSPSSYTSCAPVDSFLIPFHHTMS